MFTDVSLYSVDGPAAGSGLKPDTVSYEIKFIIVSSGNVTPTWKLLRVSANTAGNFLARGALGPMILSSRSVQKIRPQFKRISRPKSVKR